jgi:DNA-binding transcriptional regulator YhcF (GntR family)
MEHHDMSAASWQPSLPERRGVSKHRLLTDAIVADIEAARLHAGTRMPTHRALARRLGISVQTVSLSYKEAERLGYLRGEVGRGTFVRRRVTERAGRFMLDTRPDEIADLSIMRAAYSEAHERAAREVMATLPALLAEPGNRELRARMAVAALKAGLAFSNTKTALAHSISYEMTLRFGLPHGIACSFTLPMVLERARGTDTGRDAVLAEVFGGDLSGAPKKLRIFLESVGVATEFSAYGVPEDESRRMVAQALEGVRGRNFIGRGTAA